MNTHKLQQAYPFLQELSPALLQSIDWEVLAEPDTDEKKLIDYLNIHLDKYVVIYHKEYVPKGAHLCKTIKSASLTSEQIQLLKAAETSIILKNKILIVYEKPLGLWQP